MSTSRNLLRILLVTLPLHCALAEPLEVVLQNGRSIPVSSLALEGDKFVVKIATDTFPVGQILPLTMVDHIYGEKPVEINQAVALILTGKPRDAQALLTPIVRDHAITAKIPGNFWLDAARSLLVAYAVSGDEANTKDMGKKISDATPSQGSDPFVMLGKALLIPDQLSRAQDRELALSGLLTESQPAALSAYASFFRGNLLRKEKKNAEALEAYLSVPCLYPAGNLIVNAAAELQAADILTSMNRPKEALALAESALWVTSGTTLADKAKARLASLK